MQRQEKKGKKVKRKGNDMPLKLELHNKYDLDLVMLRDAILELEKQIKKPKSKKKK